MIAERRQDRELCADLVKVLWESGSGATACEWGILEDISPSGACLEMERKIEPDTLVSMEFPTDSCRARVIYCRFDKVKYFVGVEFAEGYRWSRRKFKPRHLLQFRLQKVSKNE
ncbi:MAG: PilZ domain-containing protein [Acidobacteria bacterium]|nr:PilZ domain-containing protein [Acidobacteriota bacterium]